MISKLFFMICFLCVGVFLGSVFVPPSYRDGIVTKILGSEPVQKANSMILERQIELSQYQPASKDHPAIRRKQKR